MLNFSKWFGLHKVGNKKLKIKKKMLKVDKIFILCKIIKMVI